MVCFKVRPNYKPLLVSSIADNFGNIFPGFSLELHFTEEIVPLKTACSLDYHEKTRDIL